jgi:xanthine dehydrogenase accessory factor
MNSIILIRGAGDIASGIAIRLFRSGFQVIMTELSKPLSVRRTVSFSEAIYDGTTTVEGIQSCKVTIADGIRNTLASDKIPIIVDEELEYIKTNESDISVLIDARMLKKPPDVNFIHAIPLVIGIGPGFTAGDDCHAVIESNRGPYLGRIYRQGKTLADTGQPAGDRARILRAPATGTILTYAKIGDFLDTDQIIATVAGHPVLAPFKGLLRGLIHPDVFVHQGMKIGDMDHGTDIDICYLASDKVMAIAGSVLEVILSDSRILPFNKNFSGNPA